MPGKPRTQRKKELHYRKIAALYNDGYDQNEIAAAVGVSQPTVSNDFKIIEGRWKRATLIDFDTAKAAELAEIARVREEAWQAWKRSQGEVKTVTTETKIVALKTTDDDGDAIELPAIETKTITKVEKMVGGKQYLDSVAWSVDRRCKLLGLDPATKSELSVTQPIAVTIDR